MFDRDVVPLTWDRILDRVTISSWKRWYEPSVTVGNSPSDEISSH